MFAARVKTTERRPRRRRSISACSPTPQRDTKKRHARRACKVIVPLKDAPGSASRQARLLADRQLHLTHRKGPSMGINLSFPEYAFVSSRLFGHQKTVANKYSNTPQPAKQRGASLGPSPIEQRGFEATCLTTGLFEPGNYNARRASIARPSVSSSAYSRSPPTGRPLARRVTSIPRGLMVRAR